MSIIKEQGKITNNQYWSEKKVCVKKSKNERYKIVNKRSYWKSVINNIQKPVGHKTNQK